jgi:hypothetical protein
MGKSGLSRHLYRIRLLVFEVCETAIFVVLVLVLAIYSIKHIVEFGWRF